MNRQSGCPRSCALAGTVSGGATKAVGLILAVPFGAHGFRLLTPGSASHRSTLGWLRLNVARGY
jgi:hypothetical protein